MKKYILFFVFLLNCGSLFSQNLSIEDTSVRKKGVNNFVVSYTVQRFPEKNSIIYDNKPPNNHLYAHSANGGYWSFLYERTTNYGLIFGGGIIYGTRNYNFGIDLDVSGYDPSAAYNLAGMRFQRNFIFNVNYTGPKIVLGYKYPVKEKWGLIVKSGFAIRHFFDGLDPYEVDFRNFLDFVDANGVFRSLQIGDITSYVGRQREFMNKKRYFPNKDLNFDCYFGIDRSFQYKWLKSMSVGVEVGSSLGTQSIYGTGAFKVETKNNLVDNKYSYDYYLDKNNYAGIRITLCVF